MPVPLASPLHLSACGRNPASSARAGNGTSASKQCMPPSAAVARVHAGFRVPAARPCPAGETPTIRSRPQGMGGARGGVACAAAAGKTRVVPDAHWMDVLKFDGKPTFDVLERAKEFSATPPEDVGPLRADDYTFRGSVIGPITGEDVTETQKYFKITEAYPDIDRGIFGHTVDPENPYKAYWFERWTATNSGTLNMLGIQQLPPTGKVVSVPTHVTTVVFNPEGKVVYESISSPLDRFEGNTKGAGAVFGLLSFAGAPISAGSVGDPALVVQQNLFKALGPVVGAAGKPWSDEEKIPRWWRSKARGAEANDV